MLATLQRLSQSVMASAEGARKVGEEVAAVANLARQNAREGSAGVKQFLSQMDELVQSGERVRSIIELLDGKAFQTNILALNASVEAARAGDHGRGFAVVAEAVRKLAHESSAAAKDISQLLDLSSRQYSDCAAMAVGFGETLESSLGSVDKMSTFIGKVSAGTLEQANALTSVAQMMARIQEDTQTHAATAQETSVASEGLSEQAEALRALVSTLTSAVGLANRGVREESAA